MFACNNGFVAVAELLMRGGADPSLKNKVNLAIMKEQCLYVCVVFNFPIIPFVIFCF